jgi:hypothetical protein
MGFRGRHRAYDNPGHGDLGGPTGQIIEVDPSAAAVAHRGEDVDVPGVCAPGRYLHGGERRTVEHDRQGPSCVVVEAANAKERSNSHSASATRTRLSTRW